ncbi:hypothetical protein M427DRAFT_74514 [Gonapodya prolifera JEL478]|uniref:Uncharacterized protein n=1 Tax=Gonapodya prolifera (strain JEL478) TaxID=1344416 RepID=A0A139A0H7_GONPJ|nr:hypothetical protein M427DRAFT_74514 [Gonapodya prolifera JEL478]|eukprot:KXS10128.1 hypothetical protein M427DRAFT_74514 [Gonapodya prolifera JEL478]
MATPGRAVGRELDETNIAGLKRHKAPCRFCHADPATLKAATDAAAYLATQRKEIANQTGKVADPFAPAGDPLGYLSRLKPDQVTALRGKLTAVTGILLTKMGPPPAASDGPLDAAVLVQLLDDVFRRVRMHMQTLDSDREYRTMQWCTENWYPLSDTEREFHWPLWTIQDQASLRGTLRSDPSKSPLPHIREIVLRAAHLVSGYFGRLHTLIVDDGSDADSITEKSEENPFEDDLASTNDAAMAFGAELLSFVLRCLIVSQHSTDQELYLQLLDIFDTVHSIAIYSARLSSLVSFVAGIDYGRMALSTSLDGLVPNLYGAERMETTLPKLRFCLTAAKVNDGKFASLEEFITAKVHVGMLNTLRVTQAWKDLAIVLPFIVRVYAFKVGQLHDSPAEQRSLVADFASQFFECVPSIPFELDRRISENHISTLTEMVPNWARTPAEAAWFELLTIWRHSIQKRRADYGKAQRAEGKYATVGERIKKMLPGNKGSKPQQGAHLNAEAQMDEEVVATVERIETLAYEHPGTVQRVHVRDRARILDGGWTQTTPCSYCGKKFTVVNVEKMYEVTCHECLQNHRPQPKQVSSDAPMTAPRFSASNPFALFDTTPSGWSTAVELLDRKQHVDVYWLGQAIQLRQGALMQALHMKMPEDPNVAVPPFEEDVDADELMDSLGGDQLVDQTKRMLERVVGNACRNTD